jgi:hypothetical protein
MVPVPPGAIKATLTEDVLDTVATPIVGALGIVITELDALDDTDVPDELVAVTLNVYAVFPDNPDTVIGEDVPVPVKPPGLLVTVKFVIVPVPPGAVKTTLTSDELNIDTMPIVGALVSVITDVDEPDETDVPPELVAETEKV